MKLLNEFYKAQQDKDWRRVNELRLLIAEQAKTMPEVEVIGINGISLHHWQGGIGLPPAAVKLNNKWVMVDFNDSRHKKIKLIKPAISRHGYLTILGRLYKHKHELEHITIDDLLERLGKSL